MRPVIAKKMFGNFVKDCNKTLINCNKLMLYLFPTPTAPFRSLTRPFTWSSWEDLTS